MLTTLAVQSLVLYESHLVVGRMRLWLLKASRVSRIPFPVPVHGPRHWSLGNTRNGLYSRQIKARLKREP